MSEPDQSDEDREAGLLPRRKRRRIRLNHRLQQYLEPAPPESPPAPRFNFLTFISFVINLQIEVVMSGGIKPSNRWGVLGEGGSFSVYKNQLPFEHTDQETDKVWSAGAEIVLKRTRVAPGTRRTGFDENEWRYMSVTTELLVLRHPYVKEHENIVNLLGITWDFEPGPEKIWPVIILEYSEYGSMDKIAFPNFDIKLQICTDVAEALACIQRCGVAHCDVKAENVLIFAGPSDQRKFIAKLSDFGCAILDVDSESSIPSGIAYTKPWNAPEYKKHLTGMDVMKTDTYSFGMMVWRVVMDNDPFCDIDLPLDRFERLEQLETLKTSNQILSLACSSVIKCCEPKESNKIIRVLKATLELDACLRSDFPHLVDILTNNEIQNSRWIH